MPDHNAYQQAVSDRFGFMPNCFRPAPETAELAEGLWHFAKEIYLESQPHESGEVLVAVQDSGVGIDQDNMGRLFEPFYTTKPEGMGMGLRISRSIIEAHGGRLWAAPNAGPGITVQFTLPIGDRSPASATAS